MIPEDIEALALADAIGALDPAEQQQLQDRLARLPSNLRAQVAQLYDLTGEIAASVATERPSPHVREALLAKVGTPSNFTVAAGEGEWVETPFPGIRIKILALDRRRDRVTMLLRGDPGSSYPAHRHSAPEDCYVLRGSITIEGRLLRVGDFHHAEGDSDHAAIRTDEGAEVLLVASARDYLPSAI